MKQGSTYETEKLGKIKIVILGQVAVRVHQYVGYKGKPETFNLKIDELERLVGKLED
jgi:hypothetical protein